MARNASGAALAVAFAAFLASAPAAHADGCDNGLGNGGQNNGNGNGHACSDIAGGGAAAESPLPLLGGSPFALLALGGMGYFLWKRRAAAA